MPCRGSCEARHGLDPSLPPMGAQQLPRAVPYPGGGRVSGAIYDPSELREGCCSIQLLEKRSMGMQRPWAWPAAAGQGMEVGG